ncbi:MAG: beta-galactosidase [Planctomycetota bacterium]
MSSGLGYSRNALGALCTGGLLFAGAVFMAVGGCDAAGTAYAAGGPETQVDVGDDLAAQARIRGKHPRRRETSEPEEVYTVGRIRLYWDYHGLVQDGRPPFEEVTHPDLEGALVNISWADLESARGVFDFSVLEAEIEWWAAHGKQVIIRNGLLNGSSSDPHVPSWIYEEGVPYTEFLAKPRDVEPLRVPLVWDSPLFLTLYDEYLAALAARYDGDPRVTFVWMAVGHLGLTVADPSRGGSTALPAAGWTKESWEVYIDDVIGLYSAHFTATPTLLATGPLWTRRHIGSGIVPEMERIVSYAAPAGASLMLKGLDPDAAAYAATPFSEMLDTLSQTELPAGFTLLMGDDWPLWVDEERRAANPNEADRDDAGFTASLQTALAEWDRLGRTCDFVLVLLKPEIQVTNPYHSLYRPEVGAILQDFLAQGAD